MKNKSSKYYLKQKKQNRLSRRLYQLKLVLLWSMIAALAIPIIATGYINLATIGDRYRASAQVPHEDEDTGGESNSPP